MYRYIGLCV